MKWKTHVPPPAPQPNEKRARLIFAFLPHKCDDGFTRWLETIRVFERYTGHWDGEDGGSYSWDKIGYAAADGYSNIEVKEI